MLKIRTLNIAKLQILESMRLKGFLSEALNKIAGINTLSLIKQWMLCIS
jgi:hypothetical protein